MGGSENYLPASSGGRRTSDASIEFTDPGIAAKEVDITSSKDDDISIAPSHASTVSEHEHDEEKHVSPRHEPLATLSQTTSVTPDAVVVERRHRRGLFASLTLIPEVENPYHYARKTKWFITTIIAFCAMAAPMGSAIVMPALQDIGKQFDASPTVANMSVAVYMLAMAIFPLWWSSFSETTGRRTIYIVSFVLFTVFAILSAIATNISMLVVMRTFSGGAAASVQAVGAGTIADCWEPKERGRAMGIFYLGPLCGPLFAPIIGGVLAQTLGWRSTQWFLVIYGAATVLMILFALPETLRSKSITPTPAQHPQALTSEKSATPRPDLSRTTTRQSVKDKSKSTLKTIRRIFIDPLVVLTWLRYPPVALTVYYASITFGCLYILNISIQASFSAPPYQFATIIVGLLYIPNSLGYLLASVFGGRWIDKIMHREARKAGRYDEHGKLMLRPEDRMKENAWIAAVLWPGALIWYGWTVEKGVIWIVPMIANFFFGIGSMLIFGLASTMLTEFMPKRASAGIAINNFLRNICSFTGAVVAEAIIRAIGNGWIMTILGLWSLISGLLVIWAMGRWGPVWRVKMVAALG
ncbi:MFS general substrate transporter [Trematosphaeria pertusa]|uniref:MFS general substrate transporter n=1 Tax=Trematosphaeria pertusa TaxID=390896 RepID=A0A6A6IHD8_9PLEO|nr:MFS general substrate transporter [Trematosphaeria pertusa]KAF2249796.1 MFS general substrate transporter [Trematosphaeria pertusa]